MARQFPDWLKAFVSYASHTEAPPFMHFWAGVSAVAGALRRKVWFDQIRFRWTPNFFVIFCAPPGVATKSTTADVATDLLREVPGIKFGPNNITWQALATAFAQSSEFYQIGDEHYPMSAITLVARELGSLLNPRDPDLVNLLIELWDGARKYEKKTKMSGDDTVEAPWINILGCTTPSWIADNVPPSMVGGGLMSRMIFLYAQDKTKFVPYIDEVIPFDDEEQRRRLVVDLEHISLLCGPYNLEPSAREWGREWYTELWTGAKDKFSDDQLMGYVSRKQTHLHKLAMVIAASQRDELIITNEDIQLANMMLTELEPDMSKVFAKIGLSETSVQADKLVSILVKSGTIPYADAYRQIHRFFPDFRDFEGILNGLIRADILTMENRADGMWLKAKNHISITKP